MFEYPLLKYSVTVRVAGTKLEIKYRGRTHLVDVEKPELAVAMLSRCDGRTPLDTIIRETGVNASLFATLLERLAEFAVILDGREVLRDDGNLSGREIFWRLEKCLLTWRYQQAVSTYRCGLDESIATGKAPLTVVKGFCLELGYLLRNVPEELSLAVANAPNEFVRTLFMDFYDEESRHGEILFTALQSWFENEDQIRWATPLPATVGLLNTYKAWAAKDSLLYAVALMRDESSRLDAEIPDQENIYKGMRLHYDVPREVVEKFEWHANLDRNCDHGFFPERIFSQYEVISRTHARMLMLAMKQIIELHELFKWNVFSYYKEHDVNSRLDLYQPLERRSDVKFV